MRQAPFVPKDELAYDRMKRAVWIRNYFKDQRALRELSTVKDPF